MLLYRTLVSLAFSAPPDTTGTSRVLCCDHTSLFGRGASSLGPSSKAGSYFQPIRPNPSFHLPNPTRAGKQKLARRIATIRRSNGKASGASRSIALVGYAVLRSSVVRGRMYQTCDAAQT